jgi:cytoskeletal protein CcmA (bactofilin family)
MFRRKKRTGDLNAPASGNPDQAVEDIESALRMPLEPPAASQPEPVRVPATPIAQPFSYGAAPMSLNRAEPPKQDVRRPAEPVAPRRLGSGLTVSPGKPEPQPEGKRLIVGRDINMSGTIAACDLLHVEGRMEATLIDGKLIEIADCGVFIGKATVDVAEIAGHFDGELTVREKLILRASGKANGVIRYAKLEIELGGEVTGTLISGVEPVVQSSLPLDAGTTVSIS